jgi:hypothetical protein
MLPYLTNPHQGSIRRTNYTETGNDIFVNGVLPPPCVISLKGLNVCVQLFPNYSLCNAEGGKFYSDSPSCCALQNSGKFPEPPDRA